MTPVSKAGLRSARRQQHRHVAPFHTGIAFRLSNIPNLFDDSVNQTASEFGMGYLTPTKRNRELNTLTFADKAPDVLHFEFDIVFFGQRPHFHFLNSA